MAIFSFLLLSLPTASRNFHFPPSTITGGGPEIEEWEWVGVQYYNDNMNIGFVPLPQSDSQRQSARMLVTDSENNHRQKDNVCCMLGG